MLGLIQDEAAGLTEMPFTVMVQWIRKRFVFVGVFESSSL